MRGHVPRPLCTGTLPVSRGAEGARGQNRQAAFTRKKADHDHLVQVAAGETDTGENAGHVPDATA